MRRASLVPLYQSDPHNHSVSEDICCFAPFFGLMFSSANEFRFHRLRTSNLQSHVVVVNKSSRVTQANSDSPAYLLCSMQTFQIIICLDTALSWVFRRSVALSSCAQAVSDQWALRRSDADLAELLPEPEAP